MSCKNNKFNISAPTQNDESELLDGSCSVSDIQNNPLIMIYENKIGNRITFEIKIGFYLELLMFKTMK